MITADVSDGASSVYVLVLANQILNIISMYFSLILFDFMILGQGLDFWLLGFFRI